MLKIISLCLAGSVYFVYGNKKDKPNRVARENASSIISDVADRYSQVDRAAVSMLENGEHLR